ncbi:CGNR zinc finger domain-containing protein [Peristeroidobacter agariperforans]|uniref:CGNR zinc finger domain-containing protein n=1 Tax=Peristeroidobacter agariperforans TaxID=268404 RepID=UPI00101C4000|nr:CGNR zinc finger domain-containing protein [Peristeroidobacter agariperforans]
MRLSDKFLVPRELALLYDFVNSIDLRTYVEAGAAHEPKDELQTVSQLASWMRAHELSGSGPAPLGQVLRLREALRAYLAIPAEERATASAEISALNSASGSFPLVANVAGGMVELRPAKGSELGRVLAELQMLSATGQLGRLKMCQSPECGWVFFDRSKPANRRWCSSAKCGNREKTRSYRRRQRA